MLDEETIVNFGPQTKKFDAQTLTHPSDISARFQTTFHLIRQVTLLRAAFEPPKIVSAVRLAAPGGFTLGSAPYL